MVYPPTGSSAKDREMSTHAYALSGRDTIYHLPWVPAGFFFQGWANGELTAKARTAEAGWGSSPPAMGLGSANRFLYNF